MISTLQHLVLRDGKIQYISVHSRAGQKRFRNVNLPANLAHSSAHHCPVVIPHKPGQVADARLAAGNKRPGEVDIPTAK